MIDYLNIGLDFGTHQSKVCIEDTADPRNRIYTFLKFSRPDGTKSLFLPSVVQINKNKTLSYGFVDESDALVLGQKHTFEEPKLEMPPEPKLKHIHNKPSVIIPMLEREYIASLSENKRYQKVISFTKGPHGKKIKHTVIKDTGQERYKKYLAKIEERNVTVHYKWQLENDHNERVNAYYKKKYESDCQAAEQEFLKKHAYWEKSVTDEKAIYKYFKISTFSNTTKWEGDVSPKVLSTWFLTYVLFCVFEEYPDEVSFQMGIPESIGEKFATIQKRTAEDIFYTAYRLYKLFIRKEDFLNASIDFLQSVTDFKSYKIDYYKGSQVLILPEAFAGLLSIIQQGKIGIGMTLLVDIGGGSTDISLFNVISNRSGQLPNISRIISIHRGLNYIYSLYKDAHYDMDIEEIRLLFAKNPSVFKTEVEAFRRELASLVYDEIYYPLQKAALKQGISTERLTQMIEDRPVIFTGGGGVYEVFHKSIHRFTEPVSVSKDLLSLKNVTNKRLTDNELSILSVAYGLSIPQVKEPEMTPLNQLFRHISFHEERAKPSREYVHGLSDVE